MIGLKTFLPRSFEQPVVVCFTGFSRSLLSCRVGRGKQCVRKRAVFLANSVEHDAFLSPKLKRTVPYELSKKSV